MRIRARVLVSGMGALHVPHYPELPGLERFSGPAFHSSAWDYGVNLDAKNVAVVGTGASAIQFVPQIAPRVGKLYLFQRTPPWIVPRMDFTISEKWKQRFRRIPLTRWAFRQYIFWRQEFRVLGFLGNESIRKKAEAIALRHMARRIKDPKLRYTMKCLKLMKSLKQRVLEDHPEIQNRFVDEIYRRMSGTVWQSGGCHSWYQDQQTGEITTLWPGPVVSYLRHMRSVSPADYELRSPSPAA